MGLGNILGAIASGVLGHIANESDRIASNKKLGDEDRENFANLGEGMRNAKDRFDDWRNEDN